MLDDLYVFTYSSFKMSPDMITRYAVNGQLGEYIEKNNLDVNEVVLQLEDYFKEMYKEEIEDLKMEVKSLENQMKEVKENV